MISSERILITMPDNIPTFTEGFRVAPNEKGGIPTDATVYVQTEDDHFLTFQMFRKGPQQKEFLVSLMESEPPLSNHPLAEKEVYVKGDIIVQGREFVLDSADPILAKTAFKAARIFSNVEGISIPNFLED